MNYQKNSVNGLIDSFLIKKTKCVHCVSERDITYVIYEIKHMFYPEIKKAQKKFLFKKNEAKYFCKILKRQIKASLPDGDEAKAQQITHDFIFSLTEIKSALDLDLSAALEGDPAATDKRQIILCYPGFQAVFIYRLAHRLYELSVPTLPRLFTEIAHKATGIDIHPAAHIGKSFFIDHGTGVVIGETAEIGNNVKIYQGVTLGALSLKNASSLRGKKRHPTVKDGVTIYANATILGGDTVIYENITVPSGAFITESLTKNSK